MKHTKTGKKSKKYMAYQLFKDNPGEMFDRTDIRQHFILKGVRLTEARAKEIVSTLKQEGFIKSTSFSGVYKCAE